MSVPATLHLHHHYRLLDGGAHLPADHKGWRPRTIGGRCSCSRHAAAGYCSLPDGPLAGCVHGWVVEVHEVIQGGRGRRYEAAGAYQSCFGCPHHTLCGVLHSLTASIRYVKTSLTTCAHLHLQKSFCLGRCVATARCTRAMDVKPVAISGVTHAAACLAVATYR